MNGKTRGSVTVPRDAGEAVVRAAAEADPAVAKYLAGEVKKVIWVPGRMMSFVVVGSGS